VSHYILYDPYAMNVNDLIRNVMKKCAE